MFFLGTLKFSSPVFLHVLIVIKNFIMTINLTNINFYSIYNHFWTLKSAIADKWFSSPNHSKVSGLNHKKSPPVTDEINDLMS